MAQSGTIRLKNQQSVEELPIEVKVEEAYNSDTVAIRSLVDAQVKITGTVTGAVYVFSKAGSIVDVDIRDKDEIINKKRGRACCGGNSGKSLFELV